MVDQNLLIDANSTTLLMNKYLQKWWESWTQFNQ